MIVFWTKQIEMSYYLFCVTGNLDGLIEKYNENGLDGININDGILFASENKQHHIIEWLLNLGVGYDKWRIMKQLIENNNLETFEFCLGKMQRLEDRDLRHFFGHACGHNRIEIARLLVPHTKMSGYYRELGLPYDQYDNGFIMRILDENVRNGTLEMVQFIYSLGLVDINKPRIFGNYGWEIHRTNFYVCVSGRSDVAKWLYSIGCEFDEIDGCINRLYNDDKSKEPNGEFKNEIMNFMKWLYSISKDKDFKKESSKKLMELVQKEKEVIVLEVISKLELHPIYQNPLFDMNVFEVELWSYLFY